MNNQRKALTVAAFSAILVGGVAAPVTIGVQAASYADQVSVGPSQSQGVLDLKPGPCKELKKQAKKDCKDSPVTAAAAR